ncbi:flagellar hook assembly protein FlgD [Variovorax sp. KK3]|uniref:flagellar hook assembly protein FlgD n=1 Tax=Variovorax sp. KK3 TaxID=1855728 RepID=UPI00097C64AD|nr:flagellar hook assembly protein FlgD [Variovorax sp. KK3]
MAVNDALSSLASAASSQAGTSGSVSGSDNEQRFLKLLVTQLNNQDPLNPMQNAELTSQLAQMSTVTGIEKLNATLSGLVNQTGSNQVLQAASLIGYNVLTPGNQIATVAPKDGEEPTPVPFAVQLPGTAGDVQVKIVDASGRTVRTLDVGSLPEGVNAVTWDGKADDGSAAPAGNYSFSVVATNDGTKVEATALTFAQVAAVKQGANGVVLELANGRSVSLDDVRMYL